MRKVQTRDVIMVNVEVERTLLEAFRKTVAELPPEEGRCLRTSDILRRLISEFVQKRKGKRR